MNKLIDNHIITWRTMKKIIGNEKKIVRKTKIYSVDWLHDGFCYRTTMGCKWEDVLECKKVARLLGEKIRYEHYDTRIDTYYC